MPLSTSCAARRWPSGGRLAITAASRACSPMPISSCVPATAAGCSSECRALTDYAYCCYLSDLAVDRDWQGRGIGRELIRRTHEIAGPQSMLLLTSAPDALRYYPHIGMNKSENAFIIPRQS